MEILKGQRSPLVDFLQDNQTFQVELSITGVDVEFSCFGLNANNKLLSNEYSVFFNQPKTPCSAVSLTSKNDIYLVRS